MKSFVLIASRPCISAFKTHYVYPEKVVIIEKLVQSKIQQNQYDDIPDLASLTKQLRYDFRDAINDRHIWIDVMDNLPVKDSGVSDQDKIAALKKTNFGFVKFDSNPDEC